MHAAERMRRRQPLRVRTRQPNTYHRTPLSSAPIGFRTGEPEAPYRRRPPRRAAAGGRETRCPSNPSSGHTRCTACRFSRLASHGLPDSARDPAIWRRASGSMSPRTTKSTGRVGGAQTVACLITARASRTPCAVSLYSTVGDPSTSLAPHNWRTALLTASAFLLSKLSTIVCSGTPAG